MKTLTINEFLLKKSELFALLYAAIFPLLFSTLWIVKNTQLPTADSATYFSTAINIYRHFHDHGLWSGLLSCYFDRGWRPVIFPVLSVPPLLFSHGDMLLTYNSLVIFSISLSIIYIYLLFRLQLDKFSAIVATNLIGLLPLIQSQILGFYAESLLFPCIIGCIYHLIKSNYMRELKQTFAFSILFAFAFMLRPVEAAMNLVIVLGVFLFLGWYKSIFTFRKVIIQIAICLTGLLVLISSIFITFHFRKITNTSNVEIANLINTICILVLIATLLMWLLAFHINKHRKYITQINEHVTLLIPAFTLSIILICIWFLPFAYQVFDWVYQTSIGSVASATGLGTGKLISPQHTFFIQLDNQIRTEGRVVVIGITLLAIKELISYSRMHSIKQAISLPVIYLLSVIPIPMLEVFLTVQDWARKISVAFPALLMALLIIGLQRHDKKSLRISYVILLIIMQFSLLTLASINRTTYHSWLDRLVGYYVSLPVTITPNPHNVVEAFLTEKTEEYHLKSIGLAVNSNTMEPVDPFLLSMIVQAKNRNYTATYAYFSTFKSDNLLQLRKQFDGIFLSHGLSKMTVSPTATEAYMTAYKEEKSPSIKTFNQLMVYYSKNQLASIGWKVGPCLVIKSACLIEPVTHGLRQADCFGCLLLPIK